MQLVSKQIFFTLFGHSALRARKGYCFTHLIHTLLLFLYKFTKKSAIYINVDWDGKSDSTNFTVILGVISKTTKKQIVFFNKK